MKKSDLEKKASEVHLKKYSYGEVRDEFKETSKIRVVCPIHGMFYVRADEHLMGVGCPICGDGTDIHLEVKDSLQRNSSSLEDVVEDILKRNGIKYIKECDSSVLWWLGKQSLDFYIPEKKVAIECQGEQHFRSVEHFGGMEEFKKTLNRDGRKKSLCEGFGIKVIYFSRDDIKDVPYKVITEENMLLLEIC